MRWRMVKGSRETGLGYEMAFGIEPSPLGYWRTPWVPCLPPFAMNECAVFGFGLRWTGGFVAIFRLRRQT